jgi:hypothetical protein
VTGRPGDPNGRNSGFHVQGRDIYIERDPVETMLLFGCNLRKTQIANAPDSVREELWDVKAN